MNQQRRDMKLVKLFLFEDLPEEAGNILHKIAKQDIGAEAVQNNAAYEIIVGYGLDEDSIELHTPKDLKVLEEIRDFFLENECKLDEFVYVQMFDQTEL